MPGRVGRTRRAVDRLRRRPAWLLGLAAALAAGACAGDRVRDEGATTTDPWRVRGSVTAGPMVGTPPGPYTPRP